MTDTDQMVTWLRAAMDAAQHRAEEAAADTGSANWEYQPRGILDAVGSAGFMVATGSQDFLEPERGQFMAANDPASILRRIAADRAILDLWEDPEKVRHLPDGVYDGRDPDEAEAQAAAAEAVDGVVHLLAEGYGWTEETT